MCVCVRGAKTFQLKIVEISENSGAYWLTHILFMYFPPTRVAGKATRWKISLLAAFCASFGRKPGQPKWLGFDFFLYGRNRLAEIRPNPVFSIKAGSFSTRVVRKVLISKTK